MLAHLRQRVADALSPVHQATLATAGPAGIQAKVFPCEAMGMYLYLLVPGTSEHVFNLENEPAAVVSTTRWQLHGRGTVRPLAQAPSKLSLPHAINAVGCVLVEIQPLRLQINRPKGWGYEETIDIGDCETYSSTTN